MNKKICIVGYGSIGQRHHKVLTEILGTKAKFTIIDVNTNCTVASEKNNNFDILVICTPSSTHLEIASKFKNINDLIFIEKPLDSNVENIDNYKNNIDINKIHVGSNLRFTKPINRLRQIKDKVKFANVVSMSYLPNWRPNTDHLKSYSANIKLGGGVILDFIHEPDYISDIFGMPRNSTIVEKRLFNNITNDTSDTASILWDYESKIINFTLSYASKNFKRYISAVTEDGKTELILITAADIRESYKNQWEHILDNGPTNSYTHSQQLLKLLTSKKV